MVEGNTTQNKSATQVTMVKGKLVKLQLWDTAGQERFSVVTGSYYRNSDGFIFVFDATNRTSFDHVDQWMEQVRGNFDWRTVSFRA
jgi:small GTP-binding protein